ncbi:hypothetical protein F5144DRAFT_4293 [Chaetomium tenue]|uniref:Uncharacterized protein n=1 Tax=Chaetomium tenue TaxID=1854479 RepID=A0ACB7PJJ2_9PEZI|nr:hypothetical protein F5144DRAFT_4293 [Chaetomium globosum]
MALSHNIPKTLQGVQNYDQKLFVPYHCLVQTFKRDTVLGLIESATTIAFHRRDELADAVLSHGLRLFAILAHIDELAALERFLELDNFAASHYDSKLPMSEASLSEIFGETDRDAAKKFFSTQWAYVPPSFTKYQSYRVLDSRVVLPFEQADKPELASPGSAGAISIVQVYDSDPSSKIKLVWKRITLRRKGYGLDEECQVLSMLRCLQHPNIIELYTAFVIQDQFSLLMPVAQCDLGKLLSGKAGPVPGLTTDTEICSALWGLASGLQAVHDYFAESFNERRVGCHYDIKPANILCMDGRLVLSDFGLSRLRVPEQDSDPQSPFQDVTGNYVAPECLGTAPTDGNPEKQRIGRASDIWSLACVFCEVLAFLGGPPSPGPGSVAKFRQDRTIARHGHPEITWQRFHDGINFNPAVESLLRGFEVASAHPEHLVSLAAAVADALKMDPKERVDAGAMTSALFRLALRIKYTRIVALGSDDTDSHFGFYVETQRIAVWAEQTGLESVAGPPLSPYITHEKGKVVEQTLGRVAAEVDEIRERLKLRAAYASDVCYNLRRLIDNLWNTEPERTRRKLQGRLEERVLGSSPDPPFSNLEARVDGQSQLACYQRLAVLTVAKAVSSRLADSSRTAQGAPQLLATDMRSPTPFHWHYLCDFTPTAGTTQRILVEKTEYGTEWASAPSGVDRLIKRVQCISQLRREMPEPGVPGMLPMLQSLGYLHDPTRHQFGIVYGFPAGAGPDPMSLHTIITKTEPRPLHPSLTQKFALGSVVASHILDLHRTNWLHKSLCSFNIVLFPDLGVAANEEQLVPHLVSKLSRPYFVGFDLARSNNNTTFSRGPQANEQLKDYQHPVYLEAMNLGDGAGTQDRAPERYRQEFDYYSVGLVLLEIAVWKPLANITRKIRGSPEQVRQALIGKCMGLVASYMGDTYAQVVKRCLCFYEDVAGSGSVHGNDPAFARAEFRRLVVDELRLCTV